MESQSVRGRLVRVMLRFAGLKGGIQRKSVETIRREFESSMSRYSLPGGVRMEKVDCSGVPCEWIVPTATPPKRTLFYIHGGGFYSGSLATHRPFVARLALALEAKALHVEYRLAPEHPYPAAVHDCLTAYQWLLQQELPGAVVIGGDSGGGTLAIVTVMRARIGKLPLPKALFCFAPLTDFTLSGDSYRTCAKSELMYTKGDIEKVFELYAKGQDPKDPYLSPLFGDVAGFPPVMLHASSNEMLRDDSVRFHEKALAARVRSTLRIRPGLFHCFPVATFLPESKEALAETVRFVEENAP